MIFGVRSGRGDGTNNGVPACRKDGNVREMKT
jgi:hypothetical protein